MCAMALIFSLSIFATTAQAQNSIGTKHPPFTCQNGTLRGQACIGACGNGTLAITPPIFCPPNSFKRFCLVNVGSSLCPNTNAGVNVIANGQLVASGDITAIGSIVTWIAPCSANIVVIPFTYHNGQKIECIWQGELYYEVRSN